jgi:small subunit ribosomal protein S18
MTKKQCYFSSNGIIEIDYKDVPTLQKFLKQATGQIMPRKRSGVSAKHQRKLALAIKRARFMGLMPYISR